MKDRIRTFSKVFEDDRRYLSSHTNSKTVQLGAQHAQRKAVRVQEQSLPTASTDEQSASVLDESEYEEAREPSPPGYQDREPRGPRVRFAPGIVRQWSKPGKQLEPTYLKRFSTTEEIDQRNDISVQEDSLPTVSTDDQSASILDESEDESREPNVTMDQARETLSPYMNNANQWSKPVKRLDPNYLNRFSPTEIERLSGQIEQFRNENNDDEEDTVITGPQQAPEPVTWFGATAQYAAEITKAINPAETCRTLRKSKLLGARRKRITYRSYQGRIPQKEPGPTEAEHGSVTPRKLDVAPIEKNAAAIVLDLQITETQSSLKLGPCHSTRAKTPPSDKYPQKRLNHRNWINQRSSPQNSAYGDSDNSLCEESLADTVAKTVQSQSRDMFLPSHSNTFSTDSSDRGTKEEPAFLDMVEEKGEAPASLDVIEEKTEEPAFMDNIEEKVDPTGFFVDDASEGNVLPMVAVADDDSEVFSVDLEVKTNETEEDEEETEADDCHDARGKVNFLESEAVSEVVDALKRQLSGDTAEGIAGSQDLHNPSSSRDLQARSSSLELHDLSSSRETIDYVAVPDGKEETQKLLASDGSIISTKDNRQRHYLRMENSTSWSHRQQSSLSTLESSLAERAEVTDNFKCATSIAQHVTAEAHQTYEDNANGEGDLVEEFADFGDEPPHKAEANGMTDSMLHADFGGHESTTMKDMNQPFGKDEGFVVEQSSNQIEEAKSATGGGRQIPVCLESTQEHSPPEERKCVEDFASFVDPSSVESLNAAVVRSSQQSLNYESSSVQSQRQSSIVCLESTQKHSPPEERKCVEDFASFADPSSVDAAVVRSSQHSLNHERSSIQSQRQSSIMKTVLGDDIAIAVDPSSVGVAAKVTTRREQQGEGYYERVVQAIPDKSLIDERKCPDAKEAIEDPTPIEPIVIRKQQQSQGESLNSVIGPTPSEGESQTVRKVVTLVDPVPPTRSIVLGGAEESKQQPVETSAGRDNLTLSSMDFSRDTNHASECRSVGVQTASAFAEYTIDVTRTDQPSETSASDVVARKHDIGAATGGSRKIETPRPTPVTDCDLKRDMNSSNRRPGHHGVSRKNDTTRTKGKYVQRVVADLFPDKMEGSGSKSSSTAKRGDIEQKGKQQELFDEPSRTKEQSRIPKPPTGRPSPGRTVGIERHAKGATQGNHEERRVDSSILRTSRSGGVVSWCSSEDSFAKEAAFPAELMKSFSTEVEASGIRKFWFFW